jgi:glutathione synthase
MDPIESVDINTDSSFRLGEEAQKRGHTLHVYEPTSLGWREGGLFAKTRRVSLRRVAGDHVDANTPQRNDLSTFDVILLRQDPPFDMAYVTTTHMLETIHPATLVVNDPFWVRNSPEKLLVNQFREFIAPTVITRDIDEIHAFRAEYGDMIIKPLYSSGGAGVLKLSATDGNLNAIHELFGQFWREPMIAQKFLPAVREGDKRVILVDGVGVGAINRIPASGETRSNLHVGGAATPSALTSRDQEICEAIGPILRQKGLVFVGIDVIGGVLTEINVTSPTGIQELERFNNVNIAGMIWDRIEERRARG